LRTSALVPLPSILALRSHSAHSSPHPPSLSSLSSLSSLPSLSAPPQVATLTAGNFFGEGALLTEEPRAASVLAKGPVSVMTMHRSAFASLLCVKLDSELREQRDKRITDLQVPVLGLPAARPPRLPSCL
jgi:CRP-like cAMP-binding protein